MVFFLGLNEANPNPNSSDSRDILVESYSFIIIFEMEEEEAQYADSYAIHCLLGDGGQANVYLGSKNNRLYALKVYLPGASKEAAFKIQAEFLAQLNFPHLINMVDHKAQADIKLKNKPLEKRALLVLQLAEGGELFDFISKGGKFKSEICRSYTKQLISAIKYMVDRGVSHRDLKPENILFDKDFKLKVSDFGLSRDAQGNNHDYKLTSKVGTQGYKPPEMEAGNYTGFQADIFAAGVVLFIMYNGTPPFLSTKVHDKIYKLIKDKNFAKFWTLHEKSKPPGFYPDCFKRLINSFFSAEVDRRPTFESLNDDEWLKGDQSMENQIFQYMKDKYEKIAANDATKKKIEAVKKELFLKELIENQCCSEEEKIVRGETKFVQNSRSYGVEVEKLEVYDKNHVVYIQQKPEFVLAWLNNFLEDSYKDKNTFFQQDIHEIVPISYKSFFEVEKSKIILNLKFEIDEEEEIEMEVNGVLHKNKKGEIGVEWSKVKGNEFWLASIVSKLNDSLKVIE